MRQRSLYKENHSLYEWFKKAYGDEQENPVTITERSANYSMVHNRGSLLWELMTLQIIADSITKKQTKSTVAGKVESSKIVCGA